MIFDEVVSWLGNGIFFIGQLTQVLHVQETKSCKDISYLSLFLALTGNVLFTAYGFGSKSPSMFIGMGVATMMSLYQLYQKHTFDQENTVACSMCAHFPLSTFSSSSLALLHSTKNLPLIHSNQFNLPIISAVNSSHSRHHARSQQPSLTNSKLFTLPLSSRMHCFGYGIRQY